MVTAVQVAAFKFMRHKRERVDFAKREVLNVSHAKEMGDDEYLISRATSVLTDRRWLTSSGNYVYPEDMTSQHLRLTINMVQEGRMKRPGCSGRTNAEWLEIFIAEATRRGLSWAWGS